jgi:hypothetical protein
MESEYKEGELVMTLKDGPGEIYFVGVSLRSQPHYTVILKSGKVRYDVPLNRHHFYYRECELADYFGEDWRN